MYEKLTMFYDGIVESGGYLTSFFVLLLFVSSFIGFVLARKPFLKNKATRRFASCMIYIYAISVIYSIVYPLGSLSHYLLIILPLFLFYFLSSYSTYIKSNDVIIWAMTCIYVLLSLYFFSNYFNNILYDSEKQNNASYTLLYLLPFLLCHKKQILRIFAIISCLIIIMYSLKRGGFIALLLAVLSYFIVWQKTSSTRKFNVSAILLVLPIVFIGLYYLIVYLNDNYLGGLVFERLAESVESGGSGRLDIYKYYIDSIGDSSIPQLLFGRGWEGSLRVGRMNLTCHNDFLEVLIDFGIIGLILFILFLVSMVKQLFKMIKNNHEYAPALAASLVMFLSNSMVGHIVIYSNFMFVFSLFWGFIISTSSIKIKQ